MKATEIDLLGERLRISINYSENDKRKESRNGTNITLKYDTTYPLSFFCFADGGVVDGYAAAICAAAFLKGKMGADATEFAFQTRSGNVKILCTDSDVYILKLQKCKLLYTKTAEVLGCNAEYSDILLDEAVIRTVSAKDISCFDRSVLYPLITHGEITPSAVVAAQREDSIIFALGYTDFSANPPSRILVYAAAAYREGQKFGEQLIAPNGKASFSVADFSLAVSVKPSLI